MSINSQCRSLLCIRLPARRSVVQKLLLVSNCLLGKSRARVGLIKKYAVHTHILKQEDGGKSTTEPNFWHKDI